MHEGPPKQEKNESELREKALKELEQAFMDALASGYITDQDIEAARKAARDRMEEKNIQL